MNNRFFGVTFSVIAVSALIVSCRGKVDSNKEMVDMLKEISTREHIPQNQYASFSQTSFFESKLKAAKTYTDSMEAEAEIAQNMLEIGKEKEATEMDERILRNMPEGVTKEKQKMLRKAALAYLRLGDKMNCINNHNAQSCIFPIAGSGVHKNKSASERSIELYKEVLNNDPSDLESRWLLNIAYMTTGGYPGKVPPNFLLKGLDSDTSNGIKPFVDVAPNLGLYVNNMSGSCIVDDFNNDGYMDIVTTSWDLDEGMHYFSNNGDGTFKDLSVSSGLSAFGGGLNVMQIDYNNDGLKDIFVPRGAWKGVFAYEPNSLLRNNGDGTFTDVTKQSGLLSFHPTQTACWADFNNDGWLDLFVGNETTLLHENPCELFMSNRDGTFTEVGVQAGVDLKYFVKGVAAGDYNNDGLTDIFVSTFEGEKKLLKNEGVKNNVIHFKDVSKESGVQVSRIRTFATCFLDYDNDGYLDIMVNGYKYLSSLAPYAAREALGMTDKYSGEQILYHNNHDGTFSDVSEKVGLNKIVFAMGCNFGDIDNDGYLDLFYGTGTPEYESVVPNKLFKNVDGKKFIDVTSSARVGSLQKGHGTAMADVNNDGNIDIYVEMGGAYFGDSYPNPLYLNPGQNNNHWINLLLEGTKSNRIALGAKIKVTFEENGQARSVYRDVNSGANFGSSPFMQHIGIGQADTVQSVEIKWPASGIVQVFKDLKPDQTIHIKEGSDSISTIKVKKLDFLTPRKTKGNPFDNMGGMPGMQMHN